MPCPLTAAEFSLQSVKGGDQSQDYLVHSQNITCSDHNESTFLNGVISFLVTFGPCFVH